MRSLAAHRWRGGATINRRLCIAAAITTASRQPYQQRQGTKKSGAAAPGQEGKVQSHCNTDEMTTRQNVRAHASCTFSPTSCVVSRHAARLARATVSRLATAARYRVALCPATATKVGIHLILRRVNVVLMTLQVQSTHCTSAPYGRRKLARACSTSALVMQPGAWSLTMPMACISAYIVVGPTNFQPRFLSSLDRVCDSGVWA